MREFFVARASEFNDGDRRIVVADRGREIGVFNHAGSYYAYSNYCLHSGGPVCEGILIQRVAEVLGPDRTFEGEIFTDEMHFVCPWHGFEYDMKTGECVGDRRMKLRNFEVVTRDGNIFVLA
jgi:nitrite reductase/ring-hydroxylating ferredoxin subunit